MKKLSKILESAWGDMMKRSSGKMIRKEDSINIYDGQEMKDYILNHYVIHNKIFIPIYIEDHNILDVPILQWIINGKTGLSDISYDYNDNVIFISNNFHKDILKKIISNPSFFTSAYTCDYAGDCISIKPKEGSVNNSFFIELINFIIDNVVENNDICTILRKKRINESAWGDMMRRSSGEMDRKENIIGNIKSLKPVDMGGSVFWADQNLIVDGEEIFTYNEANDLISNSEWRLPTLKEVAELYGHNIYYDSEYIYLDDDKKISFKKCGCGYPKDIIIDNGKCFYGWTSEPYIKNPKSINVFVIDHYTLDYTGIEPASIPVTQDRDTKCCVRLVKNK